MHTLLESIRSALMSIRAHGFRSFLTTLGIVIGVASVITVVSVIQGLSYSINKQFESLGSNSLSISSYLPFEERLKGKIARITERDLNDINYRVENIESLTPVLFAQGNRSSSVQYGSQTAFAQVQGTTYSYQNVSQIFAKHGRFLSLEDNKTRRKVVVIGEEVRKDLNLKPNPVGEYIQVGGEWFKVIGLAEKKGELLGLKQDNFVLMPFSTMEGLIGNQVRPDIFIQLTVTGPEVLESVQQQIERILRRNHKLRYGEENDFKIQTAEQLTKTISQVIDTLTLVLGGIVSISLLVGGIGIMNIMLVSVTERTREIGICKAIGAKRHHILIQFLIEAVTLSLFGGVIGVAIGYGLGALASSYIPNFPPATVPLWAIGVAFGFSAMVGIVFGILPAAKAANLKPIDALRYE
ncbi:ABC transporter permease [Pleionea sp. CnH1-48]|uniref:ABC transporter permease n=1 Tax=Pleionea sp. CnH1-48 TaxID=2954494 RepID=UPI002097B064|nr:ABC transporter permease [Pleionea sp. CnH1-48]MCO7225433.1 ABC transporter permease [Pleionea sp. CnH1-48]